MRARLPLECGDTSPLFYEATCYPVPKRGHVRALQAWTTRVAQKRKPEAYATFAPRPRKQKTVGEAVRFPSWDANGVPYGRPTAIRL